MTGYTRSNHAYAFSDYASVSRSYTSNGLNQYATVGGNNYGYDSNGNLTADGTIAYTYDAENRLVATSAGANLTYDPLGRLYRVTGALTDTRFLYDGDQLAAEYDSAGNVTRRYMHSTGIDEPLTAYQGASVGDAARSYLYADHQGSIIAVANAWSNPMAINSYDDYGIPGWGNSGRFQYTGQAWIPELGMYHYKARVYSPTLGRFLQTDPVGYKDQINLYAYVRNDPLNHTDPDGKIVKFRASDGLTYRQYRAAIKYLAKSAEFRKEFNKLVNSKETYTITGPKGSGKDQYNYTTNTVRWDPYSAIVTKSGKIQSPSMGLSHEIKHAARHDEIGTAKYVSETYTFEKGISKSESIATQFEIKVANELGGVARKDYRDVSKVITFSTADEDE